MNYHDFLLVILWSVLCVAYGVLFVGIVVAFCKKKENPKSAEFYAHLDDITLIKTLDIIAREIEDGNIRTSRHPAIREAAKRLERYKKIYHARFEFCPDPECACHHPDGNHDKLLPCPKCGGQARIYMDCSGYYYVSCTKCNYDLCKSETTEYWAALFWNENIKKEGCE